MPNEFIIRNGFISKGDSLVEGSLTATTISATNLTVTGVTGTNWFSGNTSTDLLRVTQTGSGNAFVVEDESNPDNSPFVITSGGSVGIGTTSPSNLLDVSGTTRVRGTLTTVSGVFDTIGLAVNNIRRVAVSTLKIDSDGTIPNSLQLSSTSAWGNLSSGQVNGIYSDQSFAGSGTSSFSNLRFTGIHSTNTTGFINTVWLNNTLNITNSGSTVRGFYYNPTITTVSGIHRAIETTSGDIVFGNGNLTVSGGSGINWFSGNTSTDLLRVTQTGSGNAFVVEDESNPDNSPFVITSGGNVGIGTTSPTQRLQVSGDTLINGGLTSNTISAGTYQNIQLSSVNNLETSLNNKFDKSGGTVSGDVFINGNVTILGTATTINTETLSVKDNLISLNSNATGNTSPLLINSGVEILRNSATTASLIWNEQDTRWEAGLTGSTKQIILSGDNLSLLNSGHTHPISEIINLQTSLDSKLDKSGGVISGSLVVTGGTETNWFSGNTSTDLLRVTQTGSGNAFVVEDSSNPDTSPFVITSGGSVGIGTTSPTVALDVNGTFKVDDTTFTGPGLTILKTANSTNRIRSGPASEEYIQFGPNNQIFFNALSVTTSNSLTVGTSIVATIGDATGLLINNNALIQNNTTRTGLTLQTKAWRNDGAGGISTMNAVKISPTADMTLGTTTGNVLLIDPTINTTGGTHTIRGLYYNPTLTSTTGVTNRAIETTSGDIVFGNGNLTVSGGSGTNWFSGNTSSDLLRVTQTGSGNAFVVEDSSNPDSSPFVITSGGSVGIGTTSPSATLSVSGNSATTSTLLVQNSTGGTSLQITNNNRTTIGTDQVSPASLYIGHNGSSGGSNGTETVFFSSQFGGIYPYRFGAEGNGYNFFLRQVNGGQGSINIDFSSLNRLTYAITDTNIISQSYSGTSIIRTKSSAGSYLGIGNIIGLSTSASSGDTPLVIFRSMNGQFFDKTLDSALTIRNGLPTVADDNITKNTAHWYRNGYIGIGTSTVTSATNNLKGALTINQGTNIGYINTSANTQSSVITTGVSNIVSFTPNNGNAVIGYNIVIGTIITANGISRTVTGITYNTVSVDSPVDWSAGYNYTYRNPYISIADGTSPIFDISPSGNVGIGTTTPREKLDVSGNTIVSGTISGGTMVITTQPTSGYTTTQILMRNSTSGQVEITDSTSPSIYNYGMSYAMSTFNYLT
jgi:hypothetical protein